MEGILHDYIISDIDFVAMVNFRIYTDLIFIASKVLPVYTKP